MDSTNPRQSPPNPLENLKQILSQADRLAASYFRQDKSSSAPPSLKPDFLVEEIKNEVSKEEKMLDREKTFPSTAFAERSKSSEDKNLGSAKFFLEFADRVAKKTIEDLVHRIQSIPEQNLNPATLEALLTSLMSETSHIRKLDELIQSNRPSKPSP